METIQKMHQQKLPPTSSYLVLVRSVFLNHCTILYEEKEILTYRHKSQFRLRIWSIEIISLNIQSYSQLMIGMSSLTSQKHFASMIILRR